MPCVAVKAGSKRLVADGFGPAPRLVDYLGMRANVTIDWTVRENVRAQLRVLVKRILRKHGYPPDRQARATELMLEQAEVLSELWAVA